MADKKMVAAKEWFVLLTSFDDPTEVWENFKSKEQAEQYAKEMAQNNPGERIRVAESLCDFLGNKPKPVKTVVTKRVHQ